MTVTAQCACFHAPSFRRIPSHDAAMKSCGPDNHGVGWKSVLQGLHDSRCAYFSLCFSYVTPYCPQAPSAAYRQRAQSARRLERRYMDVIACATSTRPASPSPHHQPHAQHMTLPFLAAHAASIASPRTATLFSSVPPSPVEARTCRAPRRPFTNSCVCSARHGRSPSPASLFSPHRALSASPPRRTLHVHACASAYLRHDTDHPRLGVSGSPLPAPPRALPLSPGLEASSCRAPQVLPPEYAASAAGVPIPRALHHLPGRRPHPLR
ncbi:hypothetical protein B0H19DRAFT_541834 [Mycena capillaripes]|nr:hypothetical protein B0H19DRAFT_541834 [Mycena capillaripes]